MVTCLDCMAQLMPLPLTVSCFSKIQIGFTFLVLAYLGSPGKGPLNARVRACVHARVCVVTPVPKLLQMSGVCVFVCRLKVASDCTFIYWHRVMLPMYLADIHDNSSDAFSLRV